VTEEPPQQVVVPRWIQLILLPLALLGLWSLARAAGVVLLIFAVASVIALILNPLTKMVERRLPVPRTIAVLTVYLGLVVVVVAVGVLLANPIADQVQALQRDLPDLVDEANESLLDVQRFFDKEGIDVEIAVQGQTALETLRQRLSESSAEILSVTQALLRQIVESIFALVLIVVISIYMLIYAPRIGELVRSVMPRGDGTPADDFPLRAQRAVFNYVRGQLAFSLIMGTSAGICLWIFGALGIFPDGQRYALFFGAFFGAMELIPYIGPVLGAAPPVLVALFQDPLTAVWLVILFVALQQLEGHVVAPLVFGRSLRINPLLVIFALLIGGQLYGLIGAFIALPIAAVARETVVYLRRHLVFEPWGTPSVAQIRGHPPPGDAESGEKSTRERDEPPVSTPG
jgi:predicted PurR-regulated permease PerM